MDITPVNMKKPNSKLNFHLDQKIYQSIGTNTNNNFQKEVEKNLGNDDTPKLEKRPPNTDRGPTFQKHINLEDSPKESNQINKDDLKPRALFKDNDYDIKQQRFSIVEDMDENYLRNELLRQEDLKNKGNLNL